MHYLPLLLLIKDISEQGLRMRSAKVGGDLFASCTVCKGQYHLVFYKKGHYNKDRKVVKIQNRRLHT